MAKTNRLTDEQWAKLSPFVDSRGNFNAPRAIVDELPPLLGVYEDILHRTLARSIDRQVDALRLIYIGAACAHDIYDDAGDPFSARIMRQIREVALNVLVMRGDGAAARVMLDGAA